MSLLEWQKSDKQAVGLKYTNHSLCFISYNIHCKLKVIFSIYNEVLIIYRSTSYYKT